MASDDDAPKQPWTGLGPVDVRFLLEAGVPREAIGDDGTLNLRMLRRLGWSVTHNSLSAPGDLDDLGAHRDQHEEDERRFWAALDADADESDPPP